ncbi:MAG: 4Fe-4S dicluster domain-containing protein [Firmicutes bacterium]|nr:4Fe-4S dicluster domain-containing protein [Bacillota bacterium]
MIDTKHRIIFNSENCIGCKLCYKACFVDVIRWDEEKKQPVFQYVEDCEHCFWCEVLCKKNCIKIIPDFESEKLLQTFDRYL